MYFDGHWDWVRLIAPTPLTRAVKLRLSTYLECGLLTQKRSKVWIGWSAYETESHQLPETE